ENNNSGDEFALAPNAYSRFIEKDFGWEDKYFLIGTSDDKPTGHISFPAPVIPGEEPGELRAGVRAH
ncbi:MAG: hypothetical protein U9R60_09765, partial [Bacteroidota bacterium]|nr:hypothetical protein [Bacteroidota bacterium]